MRRRQPATSRHGQRHNCRNAHGRQVVLPPPPPPPPEAHHLPPSSRQHSQWRKVDTAVIERYDRNGVGKKTTDEDRETARCAGIWRLSGTVRVGLLTQSEHRGMGSPSSSRLSANRRDGNEPPSTSDGQSHLPPAPRCHLLHPPRGRSSSAVQGCPSVLLICSSETPRPTWTPPIQHRVRRPLQPRQSVALKSTPSSNA